MKILLRKQEVRPLYYREIVQPRITDDFFSSLLGPSLGRGREDLSRPKASPSVFQEGAKASNKVARNLLDLLQRYRGKWGVPARAIE